MCVCVLGVYSGLVPILVIKIWPYKAILCVDSVHGVCVLRNTLVVYLVFFFISEGFVAIISFVLYVLGYLQ